MRGYLNLSKRFAIESTSSISPLAIEVIRD